MASSSGEEDLVVPSPTDQFQEYQSLLLKTIISSAKDAAALPSKTDLNFQKTLDRQFGKDVDECSAKILRLANKVLNAVQQLSGAPKGKGKARALATEEDVVERYHTLVVDVLDVLYENVDICLDEYTGNKAAAVPSSAPSNSIATAPRPNPTGKLDKKLLHAYDLPKPQSKFPRPPDNFNSEWRHSLKVKPNALKSLTHDPHPYRFEIESIQYPSRMFEETTAQAPRSFEDTPFTWVDTEAQLQILLGKLRNATEIAVDLEHHDYRSYGGFTCLMQISTREEDFIIDTLALRDELTALNEVFTDPNITKVFHGAESDIKWLQQDFNIYIVNLFDTYHASVQLVFPKRSLAFLLSKYCDFTADKRYQLADWRIRPLPEEMLAYARSDTHYLLYVYDMLRNELLKQTNGDPEAVQTVLDNSATTALQVHQNETFDTESAHILMRKWNKGLYGKQLAVFEAIYAWRSQVAKAEDESVRYVLANHHLFSLAERPPRDVTQLLSTLNPSPPLIRSRATELLNVIKEAISEHAKISAQKAAQAKAAEARGAMDVDSGPGANVSLRDSEDEEQDLPERVPLFGVTSHPKQNIFAAPTSNFFGKAHRLDVSVSQNTPQFREIVDKIHNSLILTPSAQAILKTAVVKDVEPVSFVKESPEMSIPKEPEQISFVPAAQREKVTVGLNSKYKVLETLDPELDEDEIVEVKDSSRKKKASVVKPKPEMAETSLLAGATSTPVTSEPSSDAAQSSSPSKRKKRKRKGKDVDAFGEASGSSTPIPYDYANAPNILDAEVDANGAMKKRKVDKGPKRPKGPAIKGAFGPAPRSMVEPKSGNKSMSWKS